MQIIEPKVEILTPIDPPALMARIERAGRTCYRSEDKITKDSADKFVAGVIRSGHFSVIEHENISLRITCDRGVTHELVRHRLASFSQESTRYVNYAKGPEGCGLIVIKPLFFEEDSEKYKLWLKAMEAAENLYLKLIEAGAKPQEARAVLPNSLKAELVMTANLREWIHVLKLRLSVASHPQIREVSRLIYYKFNELLPIVFNPETVNWSGDK